MLNKYFIYVFLFFFLPLSIATCVEENKYLFNFSKETFYSADFSQAFDNKEKEAVNGNIILKKPFFLSSLLRPIRKINVTPAAHKSSYPLWVSTLLGLIIA